jgi:hypothetical protein
VSSVVESVFHTPKTHYQPRGKNILHTIFDNHFKDFCNTYEEQYAKKYGRFNLDRIIGVADHFIDCGDYLKCMARIKSTNSDCGHDYFRPFRCKSFYLCPSCNQKRTILMAEHLTKEVFLCLPHRQFVFTVPKALRIFFRNDRNLFADESRLIFRILKKFYKETAGKTIQTGMVISHQTFGDMLHWNPHFHCIVYDESQEASFQLLIFTLFFLSKALYLSIFLL